MAKENKKETIPVQAEVNQPAQMSPAKIQVRVQQVSKHSDILEKKAEYQIERTDGSGNPFTVNAKTYFKTFVNNPLFKETDESKSKKK